MSSGLKTAARVRALGLIPARAGSKRLPGKNIALLGGKPMIEWTIAAARAAQSLDRIVVSTESPSVAQIAKRAGAETPFLRPLSLARDRTASLSVVFHALRWLEKYEDYICDYVVLLQPTSPLRTPRDIDKAMHLALAKSADSVVSISPVSENPGLVKGLTAAGRVRSVPAPKGMQNLYVLNGAIYVSRPDVLRLHRSWYTKRTFGYVMPSERSVDVDTRRDLELASFFLSRSSPTSRSSRPLTVSARLPTLSRIPSTTSTRPKRRRAV